MAIPAKRHKPNHLEDIESVYMSQTQISKLQTNDWIDWRDDDGLYTVGRIVNKRKGLIRIDGEKTVCVNFNDQRSKVFAHPDSISKRPPHRYTGNLCQKGTYVEVYPQHFDNCKRNTWHIGKVIEFKRGQIKIQYCYKNETHEYWTHIDNRSELHLSFEKSIESIKLQMKQPMNSKIDEAVVEMQVFIHIIYVLYK